MYKCILHAHDTHNKHIFLYKYNSFLFKILDDLTNEINLNNVCCAKHVYIQAKFQIASKYSMLLFYNGRKL